jgi:hypothetical protein
MLTLLRSTMSRRGRSPPSLSVSTRLPQDRHQHAGARGDRRRVLGETQILVQEEWESCSSDEIDVWRGLLLSFCCHVCYFYIKSYILVNITLWSWTWQHFLKWKMKLRYSFPVENRCKLFMHTNICTTVCNTFFWGDFWLLDSRSEFHFFQWRVFQK